MTCFIRLLPLAPVIALLVAATPARADDLYECTFPETAANLGYLAPVVQVAPTPGKQTARVLDGFINQIHDGPIEAGLASQTDRKLSVAWTITLKDTRSETVKIRYQLTIRKQGLSASLVGRPLNYSNTFTAQGECTLKKI